ncbi:MAG: response regulator transcription factor [Bacteroidetes bacterium]|jgi:DNA-binding NarL/FixJ family response regulator|nr:response regulator transcription factor [Bacteroidota bacterium]
MKKRTKLAIVDDHQLFRKGIILLLSHYPEFKVIIEAEHGADLMDQLGSKIPDVILMDLKMPVMNGIEATELVKARYPDVKIVALTMYNDESMILQLIGKGANGFLLKNQEIETVVQAIHSVIETGFYFNDDISKAILSGLIKAQQIHPHFKSTMLSETDVEIISLICAEYTNKEIADRLNLNIRTVDRYRERILSKTGAKNTAGIVMYAVKNNLLDISI